MCPLRFILIFLSATLAGFFVLRNLKSQSRLSDDAVDSDNNTIDNDSNAASPAGSLSKIRVAVESGFWTFVDMASGKYLWRHLVSSSSSKSS